MYQNILNSLKIGFWLLVPLLFISNADEGPVATPNRFAGNYSIMVSGAIEQALHGRVYFKNNADAPHSSLSLKFKNRELENAHMMEFIISAQEQSRELASGKYEVAKNIDGLLNGFDGVFGYACIKRTGEKPFFATRGNVVITKRSDIDLKGNISVNLVDSKGKNIFINGDFHAIRHE